MHTNGHICMLMARQSFCRTVLLMDPECMCPKQLELAVGATHSLPMQFHFRTFFMSLLLEIMRVILLSTTPPASAPMPPVSIPNAPPTNFFFANFR